MNYTIYCLYNAIIIHILALLIFVVILLPPHPPYNSGHGGSVRYVPRAALMQLPPVLAVAAMRFVRLRTFLYLP